MNTQRNPICDHEKILTSHLSICLDKVRLCEYAHQYNGLRYCRKYKCLREAMQEFEREKRNMESRVNGEEYHSFNKNVLGDRL